LRLVASRGATTAERDPVRLDSDPLRTLLGFFPLGEGAAEHLLGGLATANRPVFPSLSDSDPY
jgi:hypothetical protein